MLECDFGHVTESDERTPKERLRDEAVEACEDVFGQYSVQGGFRLIGDEGSSSIDVGVVIGKDNTMGKSGKTALRTTGDFAQLDEVGSGVEYSPVFNERPPKYRNAPSGMKGPYMVLYFGL